ncbi:MAG: DUF4212 domain-containing protein [Gammaproteobacteria bacterium]|nr:DUF4212 domain-containing protein [Gammaproteobacteria bacterium]MCY4200074.1 DUF4212 domain-containing protein [Gammaproteobacteria bacterium]MCY4277435.1 DUF4212 domain-containing protein [Gammaproteobacteria bacterium]MCY4322849.1 DUF4212 domain-containing protein [Gammaproteobacteria bacterium]
MTPSAYWRANLKLIAGCLVVWFVASFGCGLLLVDWLNQFMLGGFKLGFWFAQQGSILVFVLVLIYYARAMKRLDAEFLAAKH